MLIWLRRISYIYKGYIQSDIIQSFPKVATHSVLQYEKRDYKQFNFN